MKLHIYLVVIVVTPAVATGQVVQIVNQLGEKLKARSLVFYEVPPKYIPTAYLQNSTLPFMVVSNDSGKFHWRSKYNSEILSVAFVKDAQDDDLLGKLKQTLWLLHGTDILFIGRSIDRVLFEWCWQNGFYNVLLTDDEAEDIKLWTYHPFPRVESLETTVDSYLEKRNRWKDFQGYPIRITFGNQPPFAMSYSGGQKNDSIKASGTVPLIVELFASYYNATLNIKKMFEFSTLLDCMNDVRKGKLDMCADIKGWVPNGDLQITQPQRHLYGYIMVRYDRPVPREYYIISIFNREQWLLLVLYWAVISVALTFFYRFQRGSWQLVKFMMEAIRSFIAMTFDVEGLRGNTRAILTIAIILGGFMLSNYFLAYLSSILTINIYERPIETFEDLLLNNITVIGIHVKKVDLVFQGVSHTIIQHVEGVSQIDYQHRRINLDPEYAYIELKETCLFYMEQQKFLARPRMKLMPEKLYTLVGGSPIANNWPFEDVLNKFISYVYEFGFLKNVEENVIKEAHDMKILTYFASEDTELKPLTVEYVKMPLMMLVGVYAVSLIVFSMELLINLCAKKCQKPTNGKISII